MNEPRTVSLIGRFREFGYDDAPSLSVARGRGRWPNKEAVVAYLAAGKLMIMSPGLVPDVFSPPANAGALHILTDGTFAWHEALAHFVDRHDVELPSDFEAHMTRNGFRLPEEIRTRDLGLAPEP